MLKNSIYKVKVTLQDKGKEFQRNEEIIALNNSMIPLELKKQLNKYRHASGLTKNYKILNYEAIHNGYC